MTTISANIFSDRLENLKEMFLNLISQMDLTILNYKLYPNDQTYNNDYMNWKYNIDTCNKNLATLSNEVGENITVSKDTVSDIFQSLGVTSDAMSMITKLFENKNITGDMNIYSLNLYNNQIILNWEIFIGMLFLFFYLIYYYRKYYNTKQVIDFTKQKMMDMNKDVNENIQAAKDEISKISTN